MTHGMESGLIAALRRLGGTAIEVAESRVGTLRAAWRQEVRRTVSALAFSLAAAFFACAAAAMAFLSLMLAFWDTHRVLVAVLCATGLAMLAVVGVLLVRSCTGKAAR